MNEEELLERVGDLLYELAEQMGHSRYRWGWPIKPSGYDERKRGKK